MNDAATSYEIRSLKNGDAFRVARILGQVMNDSRVYQAMSTGSYEVTAYAVVGAMFDHAPEEVEKFCSDLVGMKTDEFRDLPPEASMDIIAEVMEREDFQGFLRSCTKLVNVAKKAFGNSATS